MCSGFAQPNIIGVQNCVYNSYTRRDYLFYQRFRIDTSRNYIGYEKLKTQSRVRQYHRRFRLNQHYTLSSRMIKLLNHFMGLRRMLVAEGTAMICANSCVFSSIIENYISGLIRKSSTTINQYNSTRTRIYILCQSTLLPQLL